MDSTGWDDDLAAAARRARPGSAGLLDPASGAQHRLAAARTKWSECQLPVGVDQCRH
jgi:hypothetical protein